jgi:ThiF family
MAGNIIPAIATTNAIVAGVQVLQAFKILKGDKLVAIMPSDLSEEERYVRAGDYLRVDIESNFT